MLRELVANMERRGQLAGVEIDIDEGYPFPKELDVRARSDEVLAHITVGVVKKAREYSEMGKYDAIVTTGDLEPGFFAVRSVSKIPVASVTYSAIHAASLIGDRSTLIAMSDVAATMIRRLVQSTGFSHKLVSVRYPSYSVACSMAGSIELIGKFKNRRDRVTCHIISELDGTRNIWKHNGSLSPYDAQQTCISSINLRFSFSQGYNT